MSDVIAIDMGGTKTAVAVFRDDGRMRDRSVVPTLAADPESAIRGIFERANGLDGAASATAIGMALPAIVDDSGVVTWAAGSIPSWAGVDVAALLRRTFDRPTVVTFDGYAATTGEALLGAGRGVRSMVALIVGTGFGAGAWVDGRLVVGRSGVAGAVGWNRWPVSDGGLSEPAEAIASGAGILAHARRAGRAEDYPDTRAVFRRARAGDTVARSVIRQATTVAGAVAGQVIDVVGPELVVWTGGVGSRADFARAATRVARRACQPYAVSRTRFTRSELGAESSLVGAAAMALAADKGGSDR